MGEGYERGLLADFTWGDRIEEKDEARLAQMQRRVELAFGSGQFVCMGRAIALISTYKALAEVSASLIVRERCLLLRD